MEAILLMGGLGSRFEDPLPKQFYELEGKKIYLHTLERLMKSNLFSEIVVVCCSTWIEAVKQEIQGVKVIVGGSTRQQSSYLGILACKSEYVLIHDAVRPFVSQRILKENVQAVKKYRAVDTCIPSSDTIIHSKEGQFIHSIPLRAEYLRGQTPQTFVRSLILEAHEKTTKTNASDDCSLVLDLGHPVYIVRGEEENFKITTKWDLFVAQNQLTFLNSLQ